MVSGLRTLTPTDCGARIRAQSNWFLTENELKRADPQR